MTCNFTNNKKNIILRTKLNNIWLFKSDTELIIEDSILVDKNFTKPIKQIVIKGIVTDDKTIKNGLQKNLMKKFALVSVYNKNNLRYLSSNLVKNNYSLISTGSTEIRQSMDLNVLMFLK